MDYSQYTSMRITRRGPDDSVLDIQMLASNGKLPTAGHQGHDDLCQIWRDVDRDDSVRCAVLRGEAGDSLLDSYGLERGGHVTALTTRMRNIPR